MRNFLLTFHTRLNFSGGPGVAVLDGKLYALGGHDGPVVKKSAELYDAEQDAWKPIADMKWCRRNAGNHLLPIFFYQFPIQSVTFANELNSFCRN